MIAAPVHSAPPAPSMILETELTTRSMGGGLRLLLASAPEDAERAARDVRRVAGRIDAWARRLTRFSVTSDLGSLNREPARSRSGIRPTMAAVLAHARDMHAITQSVVDVTMLDARLAAERGDRPGLGGRPAWQLTGHGRRWAVVREGPLRFDLDGVAKGWIADRALGLLGAYPGALVDADGDVAVRPTSPDWSISVANPDDDLADLASLRAPRAWAGERFGVATSGTTVHRWPDSQGSAHHLIDPVTGRPAVTDVVQATVVAASAGLAEALAKSAVILGSRDGLDLIERAGAWAALLLLEDGELLTSSGTTRWLA